MSLDKLDAASATSIRVYSTTSAIVLECNQICRYQAKMLTEREQQISPIVQESVVHNTKVRPAFASPYSFAYILATILPIFLRNSSGPLHPFSSPHPRYYPFFSSPPSLFKASSSSKYISRPHISISRLHSRKLSLLNNSTCP